MRTNGPFHTSPGQRPRLPATSEIEEDQRSDLSASPGGGGRAFVPHDQNTAAHSQGVAPGWYETGLRP